MTQLVKTCLHLCTTDSRYPTTSDGASLRVGRYSWAVYTERVRSPVYIPGYWTYYYAVRNFFLDFDSINDEIPAGSTIDEAHVLVVQEAGGVETSIQMLATLRTGAWGAFTWNSYPATLKGYPSTYLAGTGGGARSIDVTSLVQWIVDHNSTAHIIGVQREPNTTAGSSDTKLFYPTPLSSINLVINYTAPADPPAAPTIGEAHWVDATTATLAWTNNSTGDAGYESLTIMRSYDGGAFGDYITGLAPDLETYEFSTAEGHPIANSHTYAYKVKAVNTAGDATSAASNTIGSAFLVTVTDVPTGCSVVVDDGVDTAMANQAGTVHTVYVDCSLLTEPFASVTVYTLPDGAGDVLCQKVDADFAVGHKIGWADIFDVGGAGVDSLRLKAVNMLDTDLFSTVDLGPRAYAIETGEYTIDAALAMHLHSLTDALLQGDTSLSLVGHGASITLDETSGVKTAVVDADIRPTMMSHVHATRNSAQTIANITPTTIIYDDEVRDTLDEYNTSTGVFTATYAGYYQVCASLLSASVAWDAGENWTISAYDGTSEWFGTRDRVWAARTDYGSSVVAVVAYVAAGGTLRARIVHNQGGNVNCHTNAEFNYLFIDRIL